MIGESTMEALAQVEGLTIREGESLAKHSLWRVGGPVEVWLIGETESAVEGAFAAASGHSIRVPSSRHFLVRDGGVDGIWMTLGAVARGVNATEAGVDVGAEHPLSCCNCDVIDVDGESDVKKLDQDKHHGFGDRDVSKNGRQSAEESYGDFNRFPHTF